MRPEPSGGGGAAGGASGADAARPASVGPAIRFGAAYYPEYFPDRDPVAELALMREAGFTVIRVGESVWSTWEPRDGEFDLDWLEPTLDAAHAAGIGVILGTPTYALPMWLATAHPELALETSTGAPLGWGARQEMDFSHPVFRRYAERIIRAVVGRYARHPAIIGYQVDNEPGLRLPHNEGVFAGFRDHLRERYGDVETLNREWGLVYWSHRLASFDELWRPDGNAQPQYALAWRRYQAELVTEYIGWQADLVRSIVGEGPFVTTCISYEQPGIADVELASCLDIASGNAYYEMEDGLAHPSSAPRAAGPMGWVARGAWALRQLGDLIYSSRRAPFLVTETNASSIGFAMTSQSPYDGQWRQAAWQLVATGARMIEYWHWNTLPYGTETFWGGVLPHSGKPGRAYRELAVLGAELATAGEAFADAVPDHDLAILYDTDSKFALEVQSPLPSPVAFGDPEAYRAIVSALYRGAFDAKRQPTYVRPQQLLPSRGGALSAAEAAAAHPVLLAPAFTTAGDDDLDFLLAYAAAGGHLVLGPRTGWADRELRARTGDWPDRLAEAAGVHWVESANPSAPVPVSGAISGRAVGYLEGLEPGEATGTDAAEVLARYEHPHLGRWAALTTRPHGAGRITVLGTVPDQELAAGLAAWLCPTPIAGWAALPDPVTVSTSTDAAGRSLHVLHNWGWAPQSTASPAALHDLLGGGRVAAEDPLALGPWDVRVLRDDGPAAAGAPHPANGDPS